jgi:hypothetical protein
MELGAFEIKAIGLGLLLPGLIALLILAGLERASRRWPPLAALAGAAALAAGFCSAAWSLELTPIRPEKTGPHWLPAAAILAIPAGWFFSRSSRPQVSLFVLATTAFASAVLLVPSYVTVRLGHAVWAFIAGECALILALALQRASAEFSGPLFAALLAMSAWAQSAILMLSGSASLAQMSGAHGAAFAGIAIASWRIIRSRDASLVRGAIPGFALLSTGLMSCNYHDSAGDWAQAFNLVALLAPLGLAFAMRPIRFRILIAIAATVVLLAAAAALTYRASSW